LHLEASGVGKWVKVILSCRFFRNGYTAAAEKEKLRNQVLIVEGFVLVCK
jgi:hypothetical protein